MRPWFRGYVYVAWLRLRGLAMAMWLGYGYVAWLWLCGLAMAMWLGYGYAVCLWLKPGPRALP